MIMRNIIMNERTWYEDENRVVYYPDDSWSDENGDHESWEPINNESI